MKYLWIPILLISPSAFAAYGDAVPTAEQVKVNTVRIWPEGKKGQVTVLPDCKEQCGEIPDENGGKALRACREYCPCRYIEKLLKSCAYKLKAENPDCKIPDNIAKGVPKQDINPHGKGLEYNLIVYGREYFACAKRNGITPNDTLPVTPKFDH